MNGPQVRTLATEACNNSFCGTIMQFFFAAKSYFLRYSRVNFFAVNANTKTLSCCAIFCGKREYKKLSCHVNFLGGWQTRVQKYCHVVYFCFGKQDYKKNCNVVCFFFCRKREYGLLAITAKQNNMT